VSGSSDDSSLTAFINTTDDDGDVPLADPSNPVQLGKLAAAFGGGILAQVSLGLMQVVNAFETFIISPIQGMTEFIGEAPEPTLKWGYVGGDGLIDALFGPFIRSIYTAWHLDLEQYGLAALLVAVALVLSSYWVIIRTIAEIRERGVV